MRYTGSWDADPEKSTGHWSVKKHEDGRNLERRRRRTSGVGRRPSDLQASPSSVGNVSKDHYRCEACGKEFDSETELEKHLREQGLVD